MFILGFEATNNLKIYFAGVFESIQEVDEYTKNYKSMEDLMKKYQIKSEWLSSPIKIYDLNSNKDYRIIYQKQLEFYKEILKSQKEKLSSLGVSFKDIELTADDLRSYLKEPEKIKKKGRKKL